VEYGIEAAAAFLALGLDCWGIIMMKNTMNLFEGWGVTPTSQLAACNMFETQQAGF
jgi:hypothetical protein